jgi:hypothetical protein
MSRNNSTNKEENGRNPAGNAQLQGSADTMPAGASIGKAGTKTQYHATCTGKGGRGGNGFA